MLAIGKRLREDAQQVEHEDAQDRRAFHLKKLEESRDSLHWASPSYTGVDAAVFHGIPLLFRTRCVRLMQVVEASWLCQLLLVTGS